MSALAQEIHDLIVSHQGQNDGNTLNAILRLCQTNGACKQTEPPGYDRVTAEADALADSPDSSPETLGDVETEGGGDPANASGEGADAEPS